MMLLCTPTAMTGGATSHSDGLAMHDIPLGHYHCVGILDSGTRRGMDGSIEWSFDSNEACFEMG